MRSPRWMPKNSMDMEKNEVIVKETPSKDSIEKFWKGIWGEKKACNMSASWVRNMEEGNEKVKEKNGKT